MNSREAKLRPADINWLATALLLAMLPLLNELPWWMLTLAVVMYGWRVQINRKKLLNPHKLLKFAVLITSIGLLAISIQNIFSLQSFVGLLTLTASLKIIELEQRRDYLLLVFLGCFISASQLLFDNSVLVFGYTLGCFFVLHLCLLRANFSPLVSALLPARELRKVMVIFLQALPIAIVLFLVVPRIGGLWKVPLNTEVAKTGVSDSLTMGSIGLLSQDYSPAMRVTFDGQQKPSNAELYWRGVVLPYFDGRTWSRQAPQDSAQPASIKLLARPQQQQLNSFAKQATSSKYSYQVMLEATGRRWLYVLNTAVIAPQSSDWNLTQAPDYSIVRSTPIVERYQYQVDSYLDFTDARELSAAQYQTYTQLPDSLDASGNTVATNIKSRALGRQLRAEYPEPQALIAALMARFNQDFSYTLTPGKLESKNAIDDFLFTTKQGYCEHFASSSAFVLRAAGIPARIAAGYQGGQWSSDSSYILVTQAEAHAWVEVWLAGKGWVRLDPTTAVAPERIELGSTSLIASLNTNLGFVVQLNQFSLVRKFRLNWDKVNYQWHRWVIGYDNQLQISLVKKLLGGVDAWRIGLLILLVVSAVLLPILLMVYWPRRKIRPAPLLISLQKLDRKIAGLKVYRHKGETLAAFLERASIVSRVNKGIFGILGDKLNSALYGVAASKLTDDVPCARKVSLEIDALIKKIKVN